MYKRAVDFYEECDGKMPAEYLWWGCLSKHARATEFAITALRLYNRKKNGVIREKLLQDELTKELRGLRADCDGSEKPYVAPVLLAHVYRSLWGAAAKV